MGVFIVLLSVFTILNNIKQKRNNVLLDIVNIEKNMEYFKNATGGYLLKDIEIIDKTTIEGLNYNYIYSSRLYSKEYDLETRIGFGYYYLSNLSKEKMNILKPICLKKGKEKLKMDDCLLKRNIPLYIIE